MRNITVGVFEQLGFDYIIDMEKEYPTCIASPEELYLKNTEMFWYNAGST